MGKRRGQLTSASARQTVLHLVKEATDAGARQKMACEVGISAKTLQRWSQSGTDKDGRTEAIHSPQNKLTTLEWQRIVKVVNKPEFAHLPASQIVPILADRGTHIVGSESTFYRILKAEKQLQHRLKTKPARTVIKPKALTAFAPNQVYTWDITYLPIRVKGSFFTYI